MQAFWFGTIAVLWAGFFLLEGFDFGVGMLLPLVASNNGDREIALRSIGPTWDGNEVWLITAGGASFAAFPEWYATVFSGFYLAFALLLMGLILRGIGLEYREKAATAQGRSWCDAAIVVGSFVPALLLGVAFADFLRGVTMNADHVMTGGFFALLSPYALLGGLVSVSLFTLHGAAFLTLRTTGAVAEKAARWSRIAGPTTLVFGLVFLVWSTQLRSSVVSVVLAVVIAAAVAGSVLLVRMGRSGWTFIATSVAAALLPVWTFAALWPDVLPARNSAALSLTVHNASSSPYTLKVMAVVALIFTPIVLAYQAWAYWVFRARVTGESSSYGSVDRAVAAAKASARQTLGHGAEDAAPEARA
ncbi:cytochrome d ubiquinol oxidase subunit II [Acidothermaceae bacterium B102]|nr:cytochrome d ubiquinol oxidase subunit II [Acidothermaceae bacterium B102]